MMLDSQLLVMADELLQRGNVRGELIVLALNPTRTDAQDARLKAVIAEAEERLVRELPGTIPGTLRWRRGQLVSLATTRPHLVRPHDALASLEVFRVLDIGLDLEIPPLVRWHPTVRRLELLDPKSRRRAAQVVRANRVRHLDSLFVRVDGDTSPAWLDFFVGAVALPPERSMTSRNLDFVVRAGATCIEVTPREGRERAAAQELRGLRRMLAEHLAERLTVRER